MISKEALDIFSQCAYTHTRPAFVVEQFFSWDLHKMKSVAVKILSTLFEKKMWRTFSFYRQMELFTNVRNTYFYELTRYGDRGKMPA
jgi:hypothetical protein